VTWAEATRLAVSSHARDLALLQAPSARMTVFPTIAEMSDPPVGEAGADRRPRRRSFDDSRRSPTRPSSSSGRWTSLPVRPDPQALLDRVSGPGRHAGSELLRPPRLRGSPGQLPRDRQGRCRPGPLVPARPRADAGRSWLRPDLVVRVHVRVPDARPRDARPCPQPARPDASARRGPPDELRGRARRALGHFRIGVQRARPRAHLSVLELRRARPRPEARPERGHRRGPVRDRPRSHDPARGRRPELRSAEQMPGRAAGTASGRRSTTPRAGCPKGRRLRS
jgi:hypothetical protein